jgi:hypothetical protein
MHTVQRHRCACVVESRIGYDHSLVEPGPINFFSRSDNAHLPKHRHGRDRAIVNPVGARTGTTRALTKRPAANRFPPSQQTNQLVCPLRQIVLGARIAVQRASNVRRETTGVEPSWLLARMADAFDVGARPGTVLLCKNEQAKATNPATAVLAGL